RKAIVPTATKRPSSLTSTADTLCAGKTAPWRRGAGTRLCCSGAPIWTVCGCSAALAGPCRPAAPIASRPRRVSMPERLRRVIEVSRPVFELAGVAVPPSVHRNPCRRYHWLALQKSMPSGLLLFFSLVNGDIEIGIGRGLQFQRACAVKDQAESVALQLIETGPR